MPVAPAERRELRKSCTLVVPDFATGSAADDFREVPGWSVIELYVGDQLLGADNARVVGLFAQLCETIAARRQGR